VLLHGYSHSQLPFFKLGWNTGLTEDFVIERNQFGVNSTIFKVELSE
jgi:hypothetical protein